MRAARYYQSGLTLLEAGQIDQALVEFRNIVAADPKHLAARLAYADAQCACSNLADAYPAAEACLRRLATAPDAGPNQKVTAVNFLQQTQGPLAALAELESQIERLIAADTTQAETARILRSVPGIGSVASTMLIAAPLVTLGTAMHCRAVDARTWSNIP